MPLDHRATGWAVFEGQAADRGRDVGLLGEMRWIDLGGGAGEQRSVVAEDAEREAVPAGLLGEIGRGGGDRVGPQPPDVDRHLRESVATGRAMRAHPADVDGVGQFVEAAADPVEGIDGTEVGAAPTVQTEVVDRLAERQQTGGLDRSGGPTGDVRGKLLEQRDRALASPVSQRVGDLSSGDGCAEARRGHRAPADQLTEIRQDPILCRLHEEVVVEALDVGGGDVGLFRE